MKNNTVYRLTNTINGKFYIGSTRNLACRLSYHRYNEKKSNGTNIGNAINEFRWCSFKVDILSMCDTKEELKFLERKHIFDYNSNNPEIGYNKNHGGGGVEVGTPRTIEHRKHMSSAAKGKPKSEEHRRNMALARLGRKFPRG